MYKFECIIKRGKLIKKIIRYFSSADYAFAWLELEGYEVIYLKQLN